MHIPILACTDSIIKKKVLLPNSITCSSNNSASYISFKQWKSGYNNFVFNTANFLAYDSASINWEKHFKLNAEIGYIKFSDSIWLKSSDVLDMSFELSRTRQSKYTSVFSSALNSQLLSSYETAYDLNGQEFSKWAGGFANPLTFDLSFGTSWKVWKNSRINFNYVNFRTMVEPLQDPAMVLKDNQTIWGDSFISSSYGFGLQSFLKKDFGKHFRWENNSRCFANGLGQKSLDIDLRNKFTIRIMKYLSLSYDSRIRYVPNPPYNLQFRNQFMLAFTLEKQ
jgi:hypothetical protein